MNREIKFRGRNDKHGWLTGHYFVNRGVHFIVEDGIADPLNTWEDYAVDPDTVGQYTGRRTGTGKDVWEGDLLSSDGIVCEVAYDEYLASFHLIIDKIKGRVPLGDMMRSFEFQVIGNRWDNPELLEDGK